MAGAVPILMYHAIAEPLASHEAAYTTPPAAFAEHMRTLRDHGWHTLPLGELLTHWEWGQTPSQPTAVITFDDGFQCLYHTALPIMNHYGIRASAFLIAGHLHGTAASATVLPIGTRPVLSRQHVRELVAAGIEIGSHTLRHPDLRTLSAAALRTELQQSRAVLEDLIGQPVESLAYPRGHFNRAVHTAVMAAGYRAACATLPGRNTASTDRFALRRIQIGSQTAAQALPTLLRWGAEPLAGARATLREHLIKPLALILNRDPLDLYAQPLRTSLRQAGLSGRPPP